jgi:hypothetical protein
MADDPARLSPVPDETPPRTGFWMGPPGSMNSLTPEDRARGNRTFSRRCAEERRLREEGKALRAAQNETAKRHRLSKEDRVAGGQALTRAVGRKRYDFIADRLADLRSDVSIIAEGVELFQITPNQFRRNLKLVRAEITRAVDLELPERRAQILLCLERIYSGAMSANPPHYKVALEALGQIVKLYGLDAPQRVEVTAGLSPTGSLTSIAAIRARLEELEGHEVRVVDADAEVKRLPEPAIDVASEPADEGEATAGVPVSEYALPTVDAEQLASPGGECPVHRRERPNRYLRCTCAHA